MTHPHTPPFLSVVVPVYNEAGSIDELCRRVRAALAGVGKYELILVDDGSDDRSAEILYDQAQSDNRVRVVKLSRNFGHQIAISAGLDAAKGDAVVIMDGDLQHPPEAIQSMVERWNEGYDVVYGVRADRREDRWFKRATASGFYRLLGAVAEVEIPAHAGDFRLLSRRAVDAVAAMPERARFLRGMTAWIGFRQIAVAYRAEPRYAGTTKYPARQMVRLAADAMTSFSAAPLRFVSSIGLLFVVFCAAYLLYVLYIFFLTDRTIQGWTTVVVLVLLIGGIQLLSLGLVGQYVARIFDEVKRRPLYLLDDELSGQLERDDAPGPNSSA